MNARRETMILLDEREATRDAARLWWLFLATGIAWIVVAWMILRWDPTSISTIALGEYDSSSTKGALFHFVNDLA